MREGSENELELRAVLRERNQVTLPDPLVQRWGLGAGSVLLLTVGEHAATIRPLRGSYAGALAGLYGGTDETIARYVSEERASWDRDGAGAASDGTPYLTYEEARATYPELTRKQYDSERVWHWPRCEACGRRIARMLEHRRMHADGTIDASGQRTDAPQRERSQRRVAKFRRSMAARRTGD